jgi:hypothetical protein
MENILLAAACLALLAVIPIWPHSRRWGYQPAAVVSLVAISLLALLFL